jgi:hypothetical protein
MELVSLDVPLVRVLSTGIVLVIDDGGSGGGGGTSPHCMSPAITDEARTHAKAAVAKSWRRGFTFFLLGG